MPALCDDQLANIRASSRQLVRKWGVLERHVAGTDLSLSSVHAILEVGFEEGMTAQKLSSILNLEKSTVSRLVKTLSDRDILQVDTDSEDARVKRLGLSIKGWKLFDEIGRNAGKQVSDALLALDDRSIRMVDEGLALYANALHGSQGWQETSLKDLIKTGYRPGILGQIVDLHARYYNALVQFGALFESTVAKGFADFLPRLDRPCNEIWHVSQTGRFRASVAIDGEDLGDGIAHMRWFIIDGSLRGQGLGNALISKAMEFCDAQQFEEVHLWTFKGLDAARHLYEKWGFTLTEEALGSNWGTEVTEQKFVRKSV